MTKNCTICNRPFTPSKGCMKRQKLCGSPQCKKTSIKNYCHDPKIKARMKKYHAKYGKKNVAVLMAKKREWNQKNKINYKQYHKNYKKANKEHIKAYQSWYYLKNRKKFLARAKKRQHILESKN